MAIAPFKNSKTSLINKLPEELTVKLIFTEFTAFELTNKITLVSRTWNRLASDTSLWPASKLQELNCNVIDEAIWKQHAPQIVGISFEGLKPLDHRLAIIKVARFYARLKAAKISIEGDQGVTILTIPKGLSIGLIHSVFADPIRYFGISGADELVKGKVDQAYRVIVTKNILIGSRGESIDDQLALVGRTEFFLPKVLEAMALTLLTEKSSSIRLFGDKPSTYTLCSEVFENWRLAVGAFATNGLNVRGFMMRNKICGAACLQKF